MTPYYDLDFYKSIVAILYSLTHCSCGNSIYVNSNGLAQASSKIVGLLTPSSNTTWNLSVFYEVQRSLLNKKTVVCSSNMFVYTNSNRQDQSLAYF